MTTLKFGLNLRFRNPPRWERPWIDVYADHLRVARLAEDLGFDGVWVPEHHSSPDGYNPTPFTVLAAIATMTTRIRLGSQMLLLPLHNPVEVAEQACALDVLAAGRLILGVGSGYRREDFASLGVDRTARNTLMDECTELIYRCFNERGPFSFDGRHYRVSQVAVQPRSVQQPHPPVYFSVRSRPAARRAGKYGGSANILVRQGDAALLYDSYIDSLRDNGHDPSRCEIATVCDGFIAGSETRAREIASEYIAADGQQYAEWMLHEPDRADISFIEMMRSGAAQAPLTPDAWIATIEDAIRTFEDGPANLGWFNISAWPPGLPTEHAIDALELFATTVMPRFR